jgi:hypothetical protein
MDVASGLFGPFSDETHELGGDTDGDRDGDDSILLFTLGGDRFSFKSSVGPFPFLRLIFLLCFSLFSSVLLCFLHKNIIKNHI